MFNYTLICIDEKVRHNKVFPCIKNKLDFLKIIFKEGIEHQFTEEIIPKTEIEYQRYFDKIFTKKYKGDDDYEFSGLYLLINNETSEYNYYNSITTIYGHLFY